VEVSLMPFGIRLLFFKPEKSKGLQKDNSLSVFDLKIKSKKINKK
jgi:hypothetical protein